MGRWVTLILLNSAVILLMTGPGYGMSPPPPGTLISGNTRFLTGRFELGKINFKVRNDNGTPETVVRENADFGTGGVVAIGGIYGYGEKRKAGLYTDILLTSDSTDEIDMKLYLLNSGFVFGSPIGWSKDYPQGKVHPYIGFGFVFANADVCADYSTQMGSKVEDFFSGFGWEWKTGVIVHFTSNIALTAEYRAIDVGLDGSDSSSKGIEFDLEKSQYLIGINFAFSNRMPERETSPVPESSIDP